MKKLRRCIVAMVSGCLLSLLLWDFSGEPVLAQEETVNGVDAVSYRMNLTLDTKNDCLSEVVTIRVKNNTEEEVKKLCIRDMSPALLKYAVKYYGSQKNKGKKSKISKVSLTGEKEALKITYQKGRSVVWVDLGETGSIAPGETGSITIRMKTDIPNRQDRFSVQKEKDGKLYALSFCFPYLADNVNGKWNTDPYFDDGESRSMDLADYHVTFRAPKSYLVAATGKSNTSKGKTVIKVEDIRDFAIVACDFMKKDTFQVEGVTINNYYLTGKYKNQYRKFTKLLAKDSIRLFTDKVGNYIYDELDIVQCLFGFGFGGMEYPGLVMTNGSAYYNGAGPVFGALSLADGLVHEIAHQWFYAAVGNCEYQEAWIDEGFTSYLERSIYGFTPSKSQTFLRKVDKDVISIEAHKKDSMEYMELTKEENKNLYINIPPNKYSEEQSYGPAEYEYAYFFLVDVEKILGEERFSEFLKEYYQTYSMKSVTTEEILSLIRRYDSSQRMEEVIGYYFKNPMT